MSTRQDVLVLGGSAFLGLHVTHALRSAGRDVHWLNRGLSPVGADVQVPVIRADRDQPAALAEALRGRSYRAVVDLSGYRPEQVAPVIDALGQTRPHYVYLSTVAVYGNAVGHGEPVAETVRPKPTNQYGRDKLACEQLLRERLPSATVLRLPPVFGPWDYKCREMFYLRRIQSGRPVILPDAGRYLVHLMDAAHLGRLVVNLLHDQRSRGQTYNVATGQPLPLRDYVRLIATLSGHHVEIVDLPVTLGERLLGANFRRRWPYAKPYDQSYRTDAVQRLVELENDLRPGLAETIAWYQEVGEDELIQRARQMAAVNDPAIGLYELLPADQDLAADAELFSHLPQCATATGAIS